MEKEDTISVQWAQEDVEKSYRLLNNNKYTHMVVTLSIGKNVDTFLLTYLLNEAEYFLRS